MLFLGMERSIFLLKENWQGDLLQCSPGLAQNGRQGCKYLIFGSLPGKDARGHIAPRRVAVGRTTVGLGPWTDTCSDGGRSKVKQ